MQLLAILNAVI